MTSRVVVGKSASNHIQTITSTAEQSRILVFRPGETSLEILVNKIESCKRQAWECVGPLEQQRRLGKKQKKQHQIIESDQESRQHIDVQAQQSSATKQDVQVKEPITSHSQSRQILANYSNVEFKVNALKVPDLRKELRSRGYEWTGLKKDLRARLLDAMIAEVEGEAPMEVSKTTVSAYIPQLKSTTSPTDGVTEKHDTSDRATDSTTTSQDVPSAAASQRGEKKMSIEISKQEPHKTQIETTQHPEPKTISIEPTREPERQEVKRESISSMNVEHHTTAMEQDNDDGTTIKDNTSGSNNPFRSVNASSPMLRSGIVSVEPKKDSSIPFKSVDGSSPMLQITAVSMEPNKDSVIKQQTIVAAKPSSPVAFLSLQQPSSLQCKSTKELDGLHFKTDIPSIGSHASGEETSPPVSEASSVSKGSGKMVKDMISKFSKTPSSLSSTMTSKDMQKIKESRMARIAEMREKQQQSASKLVMVPKENNKAFCTLTKSKGLFAQSTKKDKLAAQMREKAAAAAQAVKKPFAGSSSKPALNSNGQAPFSCGVQDSLGSTLKQVTKVKKPKVQSPGDNYEISDREGSDSDNSDSEAENDKQKKRIPAWASRANLLIALEQQYNGLIDGKRVDPDDIFPEVQSCDLVAIFGAKKADKYRSRNSSGNWMRDNVTAAEKLVYKREMGFAVNDASESEV